MIRIRLQKKLHAATGEMDLSVAFRITPGEFVALTGPSGGGKTTLLRMIAGLMRPEHGQICFGEETWLDTGRKVFIRPQDREVGVVFQDYALFPNMTVCGNLRYALQRGQPDGIIDELMETTGLQALADRYPGQLSGGQQQRVALARALVRRPRLLLLDEPLSALDPQMRERLQDYLLQLHRSYQLTTILVSHDTTEIIRLADRVIHLDDGRITEIGDPAAIFFSGQTINRFQLSGVILRIDPEDILCRVSVQVGQNIVQVVISPQDIAGLRPGDRVALLAKAFNPVILKHR